MTSGGLALALAAGGGVALVFGLTAMLTAGSGFALGFGGGAAETVGSAERIGDADDAVAGTDVAVATVGGGGETGETGGRSRWVCTYA
jgi:hypothetical protein